MPIKNWSKTAASNNSAPPNGAPEGMAPSTVNDTIRQQMADHRTQWENAEWFDYGDVPTFLSATTFKIPTDVTSRYLVNRRLKLGDVGTLYGAISASSYSAPDTTITVVLDSGSLTSSLSNVALSILSPINTAIPNYVLNTLAVTGATTLGSTLGVTGAATLSSTLGVAGATTLGSTLGVTGATTLSSTLGVTGALTLGSTLNVDGANQGRKGTDIVSAATTDLSVVTADFVDITGTTTITSLGTTTAGIERTIRFTGVLTLTHNAISLILPGGANIVTSDGDTAIFRSLGSGNWKCITYTKQSGSAISAPVLDIQTAGLATGGPITGSGTITVTGATAADQETRTSTTVAVTPAVQHRHPSAAKAWLYHTYSGGTPSITTSFNVSSLTDTGFGLVTVNLTTPFSSANYVAVACIQQVVNAVARTQSLTTSSYSIAMTVPNTLAGADCDTSSICFGDQ